MVHFGAQTVTPQHIGVDQSKPFSLVKLVGPCGAVCRRYEKILPHGSKVSRSNTSPCRAGSRFPCDGNGNYAFFDAANYALIQLTGGVTAIPAV